MGVVVHHGVQTTPSQSWTWSPESELHLTVPSPGPPPGRGRDTQRCSGCPDGVLFSSERQNTTDLQDVSSSLSVPERAIFIYFYWEN